MGVINQLITGGGPHCLYVWCFFWVIHGVQWCTDWFRLWTPRMTTQVEIYHIRSLHSDCDYQEKTQYKKAWNMASQWMSIVYRLYELYPLVKTNSYGSHDPFYGDDVAMKSDDFPWLCQTIKGCYIAMNVTYKTVSVYLEDCPKSSPKFNI